MGEVNSPAQPGTARLKIVQAGDPVLRQMARELLPGEIALPETQQLIEFMRDTMRDAPGVGLAAPQIGLALQLAVIEDQPAYTQGIAAEVLEQREREAVPLMVLINPKIIAYSEATVEFFEGCLSVAGFTALVKRSHRVTVEYLDQNAQARKIEASGWFARILQHEIDHLNGRLYLDLMETRSFATLDNMTRHWKDLSIPAVRGRLGLR